MVPLQPAVKGSELALYYIFQTGTGWAGPIGQADLVVNLPYPASAETLAVASPGSLRLPYGWPRRRCRASRRHGDRRQPGALDMEGF